MKLARIKQQQRVDMLCVLDFLPFLSFLDVVEEASSSEAPPDHHLQLKVHR